MGTPIEASASLTSGYLQSKASEQAAQTQADSSTYAANLTQQRWEEMLANEQPYMTAGSQATSKLSDYLGLSGNTDAAGYGSLMKTFTADDMKQYSPAYQFQLQQGQQGVLNKNASGQGALSGATSKDLIDYNQAAANTAYGNAFNQYQTQQTNIYNRLANIANLGQNAAANSGQQSTQLTGQQASAVQNAGTAQAAGTMGAANAWSNAAQSTANAASSGWNNWSGMIGGMFMG